MNPAQSAHRGTRGQSRGRGRGRGRGGGRGGFHDRDTYGDRPTLRPVPTTQEVIVGAPVSIVLKVDQPIGHEVQGIVAELLTKGNHPRGIKVRLQDGRVGRVQRMASMEAAIADSAGLSNLGRNGEVFGFQASGHGSVQVSERRPTHTSRPTQYTDYRFDGGEAPDRPELSLTDYIVTKPKGKKKGSKKDVPMEPADSSHEAPLGEATSSVCPVCGDFEGDEVAVAHHVSAHFE